MNKNIFLAVIPIFLPALLFADGVDSATPSVANAPVNKASDASFDKRLPPVLPGERMSDNGRDVRVWSSSGPVPVGQAPEPFKDKQLINDVVRNSGIIVDERRLAPHARSEESTQGPGNQGGRGE